MYFNRYNFNRSTLIIACEFFWTDWINHRNSKTRIIVMFRFYDWIALNLSSFGWNEFDSMTAFQTSHTVPNYVCHTVSQLADLLVRANRLHNEINYMSSELIRASQYADALAHSLSSVLCCGLSKSSKWIISVDRTLPDKHNLLMIFFIFWYLLNIFQLTV